MKTRTAMAWMLMLGLLASPALASSSTNYQQMLVRAERALLRANDLQAYVASLPENFPDKAQFVERAFQARQNTLAVFQQVEALALGFGNPDNLPNILNRAETANQHAAWIESRARQIRQNSNGLVKDQAKVLKDRADSLGDELRNIIQRLRAAIG